MRPVDLVVVRREEDRVAKSLLELATRYAGRPPDDNYWRDVVCSAYGLFEVGGVDEGATILECVPPAYLRGGWVREMERSPVLAEVGERIAQALFDAGIVREQQTVVEQKARLT